MKTIIEKQILEWKEELARQKTTKEQAESVLERTIKTIDMVEGGIQAQEMLLKKMNEQESQQANIEGQDPIQEPKSTKTKGQPA
tara:strand:- start:183 stop:434 length:252 start_codon:yes stop_codon:yes gene_type:complete